VDTCFVSVNNSGTTDYSSADASALQTTVDAANPNDTLKIAGICAGVQQISGITQTVYIDKDLTLRGGYTNTNWLTQPDPELYPTMLTANQLGRVIVITGTANVTLENLTITEGQAEAGAGIWVDIGTTLTLSQSQIISNTVIGDNSANVGGGLLNRGTTTIENSTFSHNNGGGKGGGLWSGDGGTVSLVDSLIVDNMARVHGGGAAITSGGLLTNTKVMSNTSQSGGGLYNGAWLTVTNSSILSNTAYSDGGGLYHDSATEALTVFNSLISGNQSNTGGGVYKFDIGPLTIISSTVQYNTASLEGGGVLIDYDGSMTIISSTVQHNQAMHGGGLQFNYGIALIVNSRIISNTAIGKGGGVNQDEGRLTIANSVISHNQSGDGGGLNVYRSPVHISNSTLSHNTAARGGGIRIAGSVQITLTHVTLITNTAVTSGNDIDQINGDILLSATILGSGSNACNLSGGTLTDDGYNLESAATCGLTATTSLTNTNPLLGSLADNGGGTLTHALLNGSPALDAIPDADCVLTTDQRGIGRPQHAGCDIGAYEEQEVLTLDVTDPAHQALNVMPDQSIHLSFSLDLNAATIATQTIGLHGSMGSYTWDYGLNGSDLLITPTTSFYPGEIVRLSVSNAVQSLNGVPLAPEQIQFTAATTAPQACNSQFVNIQANLPGVENSGAAWGDYDNDGDLDVLLAGYGNSVGYTARVYRNDNGNFTDIAAGLPGVTQASVSWGDYDNDGDLDILLTGWTGESLISRVYGNNGGNFTDIGAGLPGVRDGATAWGDYDNDGDLDILLAGFNGSVSLTRVYRNDDGSFTNIGVGLPGVYVSAVAWGDYDNDGDLDILLAGLKNIGITRIFRNDNGGFTNIGAALPNVYDGDVAWGDYDSDGDLDILLTGYPSTSRIYRNDGGLFTNIGAGLPGGSSGSVGWGDYDNDGDLDILLTGRKTGGLLFSHIYRNDNGSFTNIDAGLQAIQLSDVGWGDYDNDGDLDILLTGSAGSSGDKALVYRNDSGCLLTDDAYTAVTNEPLLVISADGVLANDFIGVNAISVQTLPVNGTLDFSSNGGFVYTPTNGFIGQDSFVYGLLDWPGNMTATVTIDVVPLTSLARDDWFTMPEDTLLQMAEPGVRVNDVANAVMLTVESGPANGQITLDGGGGFVYTPTANFYGEDSFVYRATLVSNGTMSDTAVVTVTVLSVIDAPIANNDSYTTTEDTFLYVNSPGIVGNDSKIESGSFFPQRLSGPYNGEVNIISGDFSYIPDPNFNGIDSFIYRIRAGAVPAVAYWPFEEGSGMQTADLGSAGTTDSASTLNGPVFTTTAPLTQTFFPNHYALSFNGNAIVEVPNANELNGSTQTARAIALWFRAEDVGVSTHKQILWEEGGTANGLNLYLYDGALYGGIWADTHGWAGTWLSNTQISSGQWYHVALALDSDATTPVTDSLRLYLDGNLQASGAATNLPPHTGGMGIGNLNNDTRFHDEDVSGSGGHGFVGQIDDVRVMNEAVRSIDALGFRIAVPGLTDTAIVTMTVTPVDDLPLAMADTYTMTQNLTLTVTAPGVLANDSDVDGDMLTAVLQSNPSNGSLALDGDGSFIYTPTQNFIGTDTFAYLAADGAAPAVAYWPFGEGSGTTTTDVTGNGNDGTLQNGVLFTTTVPAMSFANYYALNFDGVDDVVAIPDSNDINLGTYPSRTVSVWFNANDVTISNTKQIIWEEGGILQGLNIYLYDGALYAGAWADASSWSGTWLSTTAVSSGQWHHAALVLDSSSTNGSEPESLHLYLDGQWVGSGDAAQLAPHIADIGIGDMRNDTKFHDGIVSGDGGHAFAGLIDDLRVHNLALSPANVQRVMGYLLGLTDTAVVTIHVVADVVVPAVTISDGGGTMAQLDWMADPANCSYVIYRSTAPYNGYNSVATLGAGSSSHLDMAGTIGDTAINYFYYVEADSCSSVNTAASDSVGEFDFSITPGS
jgi:hypothetical protein